MPVPGKPARQHTDGMAETGDFRVQHGRLRLGGFALGACQGDVGQRAQATAVRLFGQALGFGQRTNVVLCDGQAQLRGTQPGVIGHQFGDQTYLQRTMVLGQRLDAGIGGLDRTARAAEQVQLPTRIQAQMPGSRLSARLRAECLAAACGLAASSDRDLGQGGRGDLHALGACLAQACQGDVQILIVRQGLFDQAVQQGILEGAPPRTQAIVVAIGHGGVGINPVRGHIQRRRAVVRPHGGAAGQECQQGRKQRLPKARMGARDRYMHGLVLTSSGVAARSAGPGAPARLARA
ncbi:hypothetical protein D3C87_1266170 [compost metagenome]